MNNNIYPCLWFDGKAEQAAKFYCSIFKDAEILSSSPMVCKFSIEGKEVMALNGGPMFTINPSISFFVMCESEEEIQKKYASLLENGNVMMPLDTYPWAEKYAWVKDQFGITWQLMLGNITEGVQKLSLAFLFVGEKFGKASGAIEHYVKIFPKSAVVRKEMYTESDGPMNGTLKFGSFTLNGENFSAMDGFGQHEFDFTEGISIVLECKDQAEIDHYWNALTAGGEESWCGWLKDAFGISWQIIPSQLSSWMSDKARSERVMKALMGMKKLDIQILEKA